MIIFIILLLFSAITAASYLCYRIVFYAPTRVMDSEYAMPQGEQYLKKRKGILQSVNEMLERPFEPVTVTSFDGTGLYARYYHAAEDAPVQIMFHGYKSSAVLDMSGASKLAGRIGHNAIVTDQRSHGRSDGKAITFGVLERRDCLCWIDYARSRFGENVKIILSGLSMGAATVLMTSELDLPSNVVGIVADCPYSSTKEIIQKVCKDLHLPGRILYPFIRLGARLFAHFNIEESSPAAAVEHAKIPILLIHGEDDRFVPCSMSQKISNSCASPVKLITVPGAGHGLCYMEDPQRYEKAVLDFYERILVK